MKQKQLIWLAGVLVLLIGVAFLAGVFDQDISTVEVPDMGIPTDDLNALRIGLADQTIELTRTAAGWRLTAPLEARADSVTVDQLIRSLDDLALGSVASTSPDRYDVYGVDSTARTLSASWPGGNTTLVLGNQGPDFQSMYVRVDDDPRVYATRSRVTVADDLTRWRDKVILQMPYARLNAVSVQGTDPSFEVRQDDGGWRFVDADGEVAADSAAVAQWLQRFAPFRADGFLDDVPQAVVRDSVTYRLTFTTSAGATSTLWLQERESDIAVTKDADETTYRITSSRLQTYVPDPTTLKEE